MKRKTMTARAAALVCSLSMILPIFVGIPLPTFAQNDDATVQNGRALPSEVGSRCVNLAETDGTYTVIEGNKWGVCALGESENWEVTMTLKNSAYFAEYGLNICGKDNNGDGIIIEGEDSFLQIYLGGNDRVRLIGCDTEWGAVSGYRWDDIVRTTGRGEKDDLTLTVKLNGNKLSYLVDGVQLGDTIVLDESVMYGNIVTLVMKHADTSISNVTFTDNNNNNNNDNNDNNDNDPCVEHKYGDWTARADGHFKTCIKCGHTTEIYPHTYDNACDGDCNLCGREREPLHKWSEEWSSDEDTHWHECTLCKDKEDKEDKKDKKDVARHVFGDDGRCECGRLSFVYGDADGDGKVTSADIILIKKFIANYDSATGASTVKICAGADANGDGKVNSSDVILLKKYIANIDKDGNSSIILGKQ